MDWLKKYYEKNLLAGALLLLIVVATVLVFKIKSIATGLDLPKPGNKPLAAVDLGLYSNAVADLKAPPRWTNTNAAALFPPVAIKTATNVPVAKGPSFTLESVVRRPFTLQFKAYVWNAKTGEGSNFQINFLTVNRSFFVRKTDMEIADRHGSTGYFITKFEHKTHMVEVPGIKSKRKDDISELTVKHEGEDPVLLGLGKIATYPRRYARLQCQDKASPIEVPVGETFESRNRTYKVVDIMDKEVIIQETKSGEKQTLTVASVVP